MERTKKYLKKIFKIMNKEEMKILPGQLAFFIVLSLVPTITLLVYIFTNFSISLDLLTNFINTSLPKEIGDLIIPNIEAPESFISVLLFIITGFYIASNGLHSIILSSNLLYKIESKSFFKRRLKAIGMTLLMIALLLATTLVLAFGSYILKLVLDFNIIRNFTTELYQIIDLIKWPISMLIIFVSIKFLYTIAPDKHIPSKYMNMGALTTTIGWALVTYVYSYYVGNIADYGILYGGLSNLIILMLWVYFMAYIFVLGIIINTTNYMEE